MQKKKETVLECVYMLACFGLKEENVGNKL
jgi:hypothetical protein